MASFLLNVIRLSLDETRSRHAELLSLFQSQDRCSGQETNLTGDSLFTTTNHLNNYIASFAQNIHHVCEHINLYFTSSLYT